MCQRCVLDHHQRSVSLALRMTDSFEYNRTKTLHNLLVEHRKVEVKLSEAPAGPPQKFAMVPRFLQNTPTPDQELRRVVANELALLAGSDRRIRGSSQAWFIRFVAQVCSNSSPSTHRRLHAPIHLHTYDVLAEIGRCIVHDYNDAENFISGLKDSWILRQDFLQPSSADFRRIVNTIRHSADLSEAQVRKLWALSEVSETPIDRLYSVRNQISHWFKSAARNSGSISFVRSASSFIHDRGPSFIHDASR